MRAPPGGWGTGTQGRPTAFLVNSLPNPERGSYHLSQEKAKPSTLGPGAPRPRALVGTRPQPCGGILTPRLRGCPRLHGRRHPRTSQCLLKPGPASNCAVYPTEQSVPCQLLRGLCQLLREICRLLRGSTGCSGGSAGCSGGSAGCSAGSASCSGGSAGCSGGFAGCSGGLSLRKNTLSTHSVTLPCLSGRQPPGPCSEHPLQGPDTLPPSLSQAPHAPPPSRVLEWTLPHTRHCKWCPSTCSGEISVWVTGRIYQQTQEERRNISLWPPANWCLGFGPLLSCTLPPTPPPGAAV